MYYDVQKSAKRIKNLRMDSNLTQSEAVEKMGFSLSGYRKLERGQRWAMPLRCSAGLQCEKCSHETGTIPNRIGKKGVRQH